MGARCSPPPHRGGAPHPKKSGAQPNPAGLRITLEAMNPTPDHPVGALLPSQRGKGTRSPTPRGPGDPAHPTGEEDLAPPPRSPRTRAHPLGEPPAPVPTPGYQGATPHPGTQEIPHPIPPKVHKIEKKRPQEASLAPTRVRGHKGTLHLSPRTEPQVRGASRPSRSPAWLSSSL